MPIDQNKQVIIDYKAKVEKALSGVKKISKATDKLKKKIKGAMSGFNKMGAAGVVAGVGLLSKKLLDNADAIAKNSKAAGFNIEEYQRMTHGLKEAGISEKGFQKALLKSNKALNEAGDGVGTFTAIFAELGLGVEDLFAMSPADRFKEMNKAIAKIEDPTVRSALAQELLGKEFAQNVVNMEAVDKAGSKISVIDPAVAKGAEAMNDAMTKLATTMEALTTNVLIPLVAKLTPVIEGFAKFSKENPKIVEIGLSIAALGIALKAIGFGGALPAILKGMTKGLIKIGALVATQLAPLAVSILSGPVGWIALGLLTAGGAAYAFWPEISGFFTDMWDSVVGWFSEIDWSNAWKYLTPIGLAVLFWEGVKKPLGDMWNSISGWFASIEWSKLWTWFTEPVGNLWGDIKSSLLGIWDGITGWFSSLSWSGLWSGLVDSVTNIGTKIVNKFKNMWKGIKSTFGFGGDATISSGYTQGNIEQGSPVYIGAAEGGYISAAEGGYISGPGTSFSDSINARLSNGEFVVNAKDTAKNRGTLESINSGRSPKSNVENLTFNVTVSSDKSAKDWIEELSEASLGEFGVALVPDQEVII